MAQYVHLLSSTPLSMPTDLWVPITKDISPMYANQYSIGGYYSGLPGWEFSVEGYYKQMKHILEYQDGVSFFGTSTNWEEKVEMGEGRSFGLELMAQKTLGKTTGWLAYTLSKTDHRFKNGTINQGRWFPTNMTAATASASTSAISSVTALMQELPDIQYRWMYHYPRKGNNHHQARWLY